jgi:hypothetical protein
MPREHLDPNNGVQASTDTDRETPQTGRCAWCEDRGGSRGLRGGLLQRRLYVRSLQREPDPCHGLAWVDLTVETS